MEHIDVCHLQDVKNLCLFQLASEEQPGLCLVPLKSTVALGKNNVAHCIIFRLFVVDNILP